MISIVHYATRPGEIHCQADDRYLLCITPIGIVIRCRTCKRDHELSWEYLDLIRQQMVAACGDARTMITG